MEGGPLEAFIAEIVDDHVVTIDVDTLVSNNQLFEGTSVQILASRDEHVGIPNLQLLGIQGQE